MATLQIHNRLNMAQVRNRSSLPSRADSHLKAMHGVPVLTRGQRVILVEMVEMAEMMVESCQSFGTFLVEVVNDLCGIFRGVFHCRHIV